MQLKFADGSQFASGCTAYNTVPGTETSAKITLVVSIGSLMIEAIVDTCADYVICGAEEAQILREQSTESIGDITIPLNGRLLNGSLHRLPLHLVADEGEGLSLHVPAFLPAAGQQVDPDLLPRSRLGLLSCLDSMLYGVDPFRRMFYFG